MYFGVEKEKRRRNGTTCFNVESILARCYYTGAYPYRTNFREHRRKVRGSFEYSPARQKRSGCNLRITCAKFLWGFVSIFTVCVEVWISCTFDFRSRGLIPLLERKLVQRSYVARFLYNFSPFFLFFFVPRSYTILNAINKYR